MISLVRHWRQRHWQNISAAEYGAAYARFGGSFAVHPRVVATIESLRGLPVRYLGYQRDGEWLAAIPVWGHHVVGTKAALKSYQARQLIDTGDAEVILPIADRARVSLPFRADFLSALHADHIVNLRRESRFSLMLAKSHARGDQSFSKKFRYNRQRELRLFEEAGGSHRSVADLPPAEVAAAYARLFEKRWGFPAPGGQGMGQVLGELRDLLRGYVLYQGEQPIAVQIVYRIETPQWLLAAYVNGGVDPDFKHLSPGSILCFLNTQLLEEDAQRLQKPLRYSFGKNDAEYKTMWCYEVPAYRLG